MRSYLNIDNIRSSTPEVELHPLVPFLPEKGKVLFLGSFPPQRKRWCIDFYYPNFINDHWRIEGAVFYADKLHFVDQEHKTFRLPEIIQHCENYGIGFFDTASAVHRLKDNASDKFLEVVQQTDIDTLVSKMPDLKAIVVTGEKAATTICQHVGIDELPKVNTFITLPSSLELYRLPSSSRAYPLAFEKKVAAYKAMFDRYLQ